MHQSKYKKYIKYKKKYLLLKNNLGRSSNLIEDDTKFYDYTNSDEVLKYVSSVIPKENLNDKPYLLVLYGPPGSGKTYDKQFIIKKLKLCESYVYFSEDEYAYNTKQFNEIKNNTDLTNLKNLTQEELESNDVIMQLQNEYSKIKKATSNIIFMLLGLTLMYKHNAIIEMTGGGLGWYMTNIIDEFYHKKYDIKFVYPYVDNIDTLLERTRKRGFKEYRFLTEKYLRDTVKRSRDNFNKLIQSDDVKKFNEIIMYDVDKARDNFEDSLIHQYKDGVKLI